jgi:peptide-methionine (S)-S-oxide reductase
MFFSKSGKSAMVSAADALPGRDRPMPVPARHLVLDAPVAPPFPAGLEMAWFAMGCFWGAEKLFWQVPGVYSTAVGYMAGFTPHPTYEEVCSGRTGHTETVQVVFDPAKISLDSLLRLFWEGHDPTQGMGQGNDRGSQYRSGIYLTENERLERAEASRAAYQERLRAAGFADITTEITPAGTFYYAEGYHQQYLAGNPGGYCGLGGTGVSCPVGLGSGAEDEC